MKNQAEPVKNKSSKKKYIVRTVVILLVLALFIAVLALSVGNDT